MADDVHLRIVAEHRLANVIRLLRQPHAVDFAAGAGDFAGHAAAAGGIGENPIRAAAVAFRAELADVLADLVHGILLRSQLIGLPFGLRITEVRLRRIAGFGRGV